MNLIIIILILWLIFEDMEGEKFEVIGSNIIIEKNDRRL